MNTNFVEFKLADCETRIIINVSKILNFFETSNGGCTIVLSAEENFRVAHKYIDVINMIECSSLKTIQRLI